MSAPQLGPKWELARRIVALERGLLALATQAVLTSSSADGTNGAMSIIADAVNSQPAIQFTYTGGGGSLLAQIYQTTAGAVQITGGLQVSGTKNFVMNHPTREGWTLRHASTESPVNGVEYWGEGVFDETGACTVALPEYFEALTAPTGRAVTLTPIGRDPFPVSAERIEDGLFAAYGPPGAEFSWLVKAERIAHPADWPIDFATEEPGTVPSPADFPAEDRPDPAAPDVPEPSVITLPDFTAPA